MFFREFECSNAHLVMLNVYVHVKWELEWIGLKEKTELKLVVMADCEYEHLCSYALCAIRVGGRWK